MPLRFVDSVAGVAAAAWDRLAGDDVLASWGWLRTVEQTYRGPSTALYLLAEDGGELVGAAPCRLWHGTDGCYSLDDQIFGRVVGWAHWTALSLQPALVCGALAGYGSHLLTASGLDVTKARDLRSALLAELDAEASRRNIGLAFVHVKPCEADLFDLLDAPQWLNVNVLPQTRMRLRWNSFEHYREALASRRRRRSIRRELRREREAGVDFSEGALDAEDRERIFGLLDAHHLRMTGRPAPFSTSFIETLERNLGGDMRLFTARCEGRLVGALLELCRDGIAHAMMVGVDRDRSGPFTYFALGYHGLEQAIERGARQAWDGPGAYGAKVARGFELVELRTFYRPARSRGHTAWRIWFALLDRWLRYKVDRDLSRRARRRAWRDG